MEAETETEVEVVLTLGLSAGPRGMRWRCQIEREDAREVLPPRCLRVIGYGAAPVLALLNALDAASEGAW